MGRQLWTARCALLAHTFEKMLAGKLRAGRSVSVRQGQVANTCCGLKRAARPEVAARSRQTTTLSSRRPLSICVHSKTADLLGFLQQRWKNFWPGTAQGRRTARHTFAVPCLCLSLFIFVPCRTSNNEPKRSEAKQKNK